MALAASKKRKQAAIQAGDGSNSTGGLSKTVAEARNSDSEANNGNTSDWTTVNASGKPKKKPKKEKSTTAGAASLSAAPLFQFDPAGFRTKNAISVSDMRDMMLHMLAKAPYPRWLNIKNKQAIRGVVCILLQGIEAETLGLPANISSNMPQDLQPGMSKTKLPVFTQLFSHYCPTRAPGEPKKLHSVMQTLLNAPVPNGEKAKREAQRAKTASQAGGIDPAQYLLDPEGFLENGYIMPTYDFDTTSRLLDVKGKKPEERRTTLPFEQWQRDDGLIETPQLDYESSDRPLLRILGIDCEMCVTKAGSEVCRISVIDSSGRVIYNTLVKPAHDVVDYATIYSGITAELLHPVTTTLLDVQTKLAELIDYDTVLVGHSLNCDLVVLKFAHPWVIDTSLIYHHTRGPPFKASLKWLANKWLNKEIQKPSKLGDVDTIGHDSEEDARAAVELVKLKMEKGPSFGEFANDQESIFERLARTEEDRKIRSCMVDHGNPGQWHGSKADTAIACKTDQEVVQGVVANAASHEFIFARLLDLSHQLGWSQPSNTVTGRTTAAAKNAAVSSEPATSDLSTATTNGSTDPNTSYARLNEQLRTLYDSLPANTAFIVMSGHNDPRKVLSLSAKKNRFDLLFKTGTLISSMDDDTKWTEADERAQATEVAKVREGMSFLAIKR